MAFFMKIKKELVQYGFLEKFRDLLRFKYVSQNMPIWEWLSKPNQTVPTTFNTFDFTIFDVGERLFLFTIKYLLL